jgi:hypothetical protein
MEQTKLFLSHSQLSKASCGRRWELGYVEKLELIPSADSRNFIFGKAFHAGLAAYLDNFSLEEANQGVLDFMSDELIMDKLDYNQNPDLDYYDMMTDVQHNVLALVKWFVEATDLASKYRVATLNDVFGDEGLGVITCENCDDYGEVEHTCDDCSGDGHDYEYDCDRCSGSGYLDEDDDDYDDEYDTCPDCDGDGYIQDECWSCNGEGTTWEECEKCDGTQELPNKTKMIEWEFNYELSDLVTLRGFVDAVLIDLETNELILVDWKTRSKGMTDTQFALLDGQLHTYAAVIRELGGKITKVRMWQVKQTLPAPPTLTKSGKPSIAMNAKSTTREVWLEGLTEEQLAKYGHMVEEVQSIKPLDYFTLESDGFVSDNSHKLAMDNIQAQTELIQFFNDEAQQGKALPALYSSWNCKGCPFTQLCGTVFRYGGDAQPVIDQYYQKKTSLDKTGEDD